MAKFESKYGLNDVVWRADSYGFERDIIQEVKFGKSISYRFKSARSTWSIFSYGNDEKWVTEAGVFETEAEAQKYHERLKAKREKADAKKAAEEKQARVIKLKAELEAAKQGINLDDSDQDV